MIGSRRETAVGTGVHDLRIFRRRRDPARLAATDVVPIARADAAFSRAARDAHGGVVLLRAVDVVRKIVVEGHAIELRRRLILFGPTAAAIQRDIRATVVTLDHAIGIVGRDPKIVVIAVRYGNAGERAAAVV